MKKITICAMLLILATTSFSQQTQSSKPLTREEYLTKSKNQKIFGFILLGAGVTSLAIAAYGGPSFDVLPVLAIGGTLSTLGSIPLFIASRRNKRKTMNTSASLKIEKTQTMQQTGISFHSLPAISVKINL